VKKLAKFNVEVEADNLKELGEKLETLTKVEKEKEE